MAPGLRGIEIDTTIFRPATFIEQSIDNLTRAMLVGVLLVVLIIVAFLFEWRTAFIRLVAIPLSLVAALLVLDATGTTVNVMVLAGLVVAIGVVVDDAIIDVENIVRRLRQARAQGSPSSTFRIVLDASVEVRSAITYATVINVVAVVPVLFLEGLSGSFFRPLVLSYGLAVLVSMVVALTVTPALCLVMLNRGDAHAARARRCCACSSAGYRAVARAGAAPTEPGGGRRARASRWPALLAAPTLGSQLLPNFKERDFLMHWLTQPGTSVTEEYRISVAACKDLQQDRRACATAARTSARPCSPTRSTASTSARTGSASTPPWTTTTALADVQHTVEAYPGLYRDVQTYLRERIKEVLTGSSESIVVRIYGPDLAVLREKAKEIEGRIAGIPGDRRRARLAADRPAAHRGRAGPRGGPPRTA